MLRHSAVESFPVPLCLLMKSMILCSPSPGTLASDRNTWRRRFRVRSLNTVWTPFPVSLNVAFSSWQLPSLHSFPGSPWRSSNPGRCWVCRPRSSGDTWPGCPWTLFPADTSRNILLACFNIGLNGRFALKKKGFFSSTARFSWNSSWNNYNILHILLHLFLQI